MSSLKVLVLCGRSPRHLYVANRLCQAADVLAIVHESGQRVDFERVRKLLLRPRTLIRKAWRWLRDRRRYAGNPEERYFFADAPARLDRPELVRNVPDVNDSSLVDLCDELQPDVIMVFGTSLIRGPLLKKGRLGIVNLHGGLSPEYRGADCTFWALYNGEVDKVGCTIHYINSGIDTGHLIAHICPTVNSCDDELTLFWRAIRESAEVYAELIKRLEKRHRLGKAQEDKGQLYQVKDRSYRHERQLARAISDGLLSNVLLPLRVRWFADDE